MFQVISELWGIPLIFSSLSQTHTHTHFSCSLLSLSPDILSLLPDAFWMWSQLCSERKSVKCLKKWKWFWPAVPCFHFSSLRRKDGAAKQGACACQAAAGSIEEFVIFAATAWQRSWQHNEAQVHLLTVWRESTSQLQSLLLRRFFFPPPPHNTWRGESQRLFLSRLDFLLPIKISHPFAQKAHPSRPLSTSSLKNGYRQVLDNLKREELQGLNPNATGGRSGG